MPIGKPLDELYYLVMDYVPQGILYDIVEHFDGVGEIVARYFMNQIIEAMQYIQDNKVVHGDLKPENILVNDKFEIKITDFGFATYQH